MSGGQIAALIFGIILLVPGGCFTVVGIAMLNDPGSYGLGPPMLIVGLIILALVVLLGRFAFRRRQSPPPSAP